MKKQETFEANLDNGERAIVTYESEYVSEGVFINEVKKVVYKNIDITPVFSCRNVEDLPLGIWQSVEHNSHSLWSKNYKPVNQN